MNREIIRIVAAKGFGFIHGEDGLPYFVHRSAFRGDVVFEGLSDGQRASPSRRPAPPMSRAPNTCTWRRPNKNERERLWNDGERR
jgi:cold shock CspA family protein